MFWEFSNDLFETKISLGLILAISACKYSNGSSVVKNSHVVISIYASPADLLSATKHIRKLFRFLSIKLSSVTVPAVTTRTTDLSTIPFESLGSLVCSQIATLYPLLINLGK